MSVVRLVVSCILLFFLPSIWFLDLFLFFLYLLPFLPFYLFASSFLTSPIPPYPLSFFLSSFLLPFLPYSHPFRLPSFFPSFSIPSFPSHLSYITLSLPSSHLSSIPSSQSFQLALKYFLVWILFSVDVHECILHMTISFKNG